MYFYQFNDNSTLNVEVTYQNKFRVQPLMISLSCALFIYIFIFLGCKGLHFFVSFTYYIKSNTNYYVSSQTAS